MKRLDTRTVELLPGELHIVDQFEDALTDGLGIQAAAWKVLPRFGRPRWNEPPRWVTREFIEYLSDGTVTLDHHGRYVRRSSENVPNTMPLEFCDYCQRDTPTGTSPSGVRYCDVCAHDESRNA